MQRLKINIAVRSLLLICVGMQMLMLMPHHHHGDNPAACINPLHCLDSSNHTHPATNLPLEQCTGHSACSHDHGLAMETSGLNDEPCCDHRHHDGRESCALTDVDLTTPQRDDDQNDAYGADIVSLPLLYIIVANTNAVPSALLANGIRSARAEGELPGYTDFITPQVSARAPSFTV